MSNMTSVPASCHCKAVDTVLEFPTTSLPLPTNICHCDSSRHVSGTMCTSYVVLASPLELDQFPSLVGYQSSTDLTRYFCKTCGCHMFGFHSPSSTWKVATGALDKIDGIVKVQANMWISDTLDGGLADRIPHVGGQQLPRLKEGVGSEELPSGWKEPVIAKAEPKSGEDKLHLSCHCGGVRLYVTKPPKDIPEHQRRFMRDPKRWMASNCVCTSCRKTLGFEIQNWTFVFPGYIFQMDGKPLPFDPKSPGRTWSGENDPQPGGPGTLQEYRSSELVHREFCGRCGATVFFWDEGRMQVIDISFGLLDHAGVGSRRDDWTMWMSGVSYTEDSINPSLLEGLQDGLKAVALDNLSLGLGDRK
ncbi:MAG: hypothetical protein M4579_004655 [Chaenotheca gracillima]|nr:MAG: hypothetical protein M4579_004655 [Chaenotheca gracillima]